MFLHCFFFETVPSLEIFDVFTSSGLSTLAFPRKSTIWFCQEVLGELKFSDRTVENLLWSPHYREQWASIFFVTWLELLLEHLWIHKQILDQKVLEFELILVNKLKETKCEQCLEKVWQATKKFFFLTICLIELTFQFFLTPFDVFDLHSLVTKITKQQKRKVTTLDIKIDVTFWEEELEVEFLYLLILGHFVWLSRAQTKQEKSEQEIKLLTCWCKLKKSV